MTAKTCYLAEKASLKWLEAPSVYDIRSDELYEVDEEAFDVLRQCASERGCALEDGEFLEFCLREGILRERFSKVSKVPARQSPLPSLRYLELHITHRCNLRCRHCYIEEGGGELGVESVRSILEQFERMQGLRVLISGGEPLMHSGFFDINALLPEYDLRTVLFTNGTLFSRERVRALSVDEVQVSVDGLREAHDWMRGRGAFSKALNAIRLSRESGIDVSVSTMVTVRNLQDFPEMSRLFRELGVKDWTVDIPCSAGAEGTPGGTVPPPDIAGRYLQYGYGEGLHGGGEGYACGLHLMCVFPDGNAAKCGFYGASAVGHVSEGLEECWKRIRHVRLDELECDCREIDVCRGGCRFRAERASHRLAKDLYRCAALRSGQGA